MISGDSRKQPETELAALLHGLHYRGLAVGPDDAARVAAVFQQAADWPYERRVRILKSLLARSAEERRLIDQLAPFLFVNAQKHDEESSVGCSSLASAKEEEAVHILQPPHSSPAQTDSFDYVQDRLHKAERSDTKPRKIRPSTLLHALLRLGRTGRSTIQRWLKGHWPGLAVCLCLILTAAIAWHMMSEQPAPEPPPNVDRPPEQISTPEPAEKPLPIPTVELDQTEPPPPPHWPFWALLGLSCVPIAAYLFHHHVRFRRQQLTLATLAASTGPRTYRLDIPAEQFTTPLNPNIVREAAFHLSAASAHAPAPWLDVGQTVQATARNAGQLTLCFATWFEHRPLLFIEDIAPSMLRWPSVGRQIGDALARQGGRVEHYFMDRTPEMLSPEPDLAMQIPLEQVLAQLSDPAVVVLSDAAALDVYGATTRSSWVGALTHATWLHPREPDLWGPGACWLAEYLQVVPLNDEGLLRLGTPRTGGNGELPRRWRPAQVLSQGIDVRLAAIRAILDDQTFWWFGAGAVLDRVGALTTRLWWALRSDLIADVPRNRLERVWELADVQLGADGTVRLSSDLREALIELLTKERPRLLSEVVAWAEQRVMADLQRLAPQSLAAIEARALLARLQLLDPQRHTAARQTLKSLARDGFGEWVDAGEVEEGLIRRLRVSLAPPQRPGKGLLAALAGGVAGVVLAVVGLQNPQRFFPTVEAGRVVLQAEVISLSGGGFGKGVFGTGVFDGLDNKVRLSWQLQEDPGESTPTQWQVWRDEREVAQVKDMRWEDVPPGDGPWRYQVKAVGLDGQPYRSDVVVVESAGKPPLPVPSRAMVPVPAGKFWMGCGEQDEDCDNDEKPGRMVTLDAYAIDQHEVTVADYRRCVEAKVCSPPDTGSFCNWEQKGREDHPVNCVDWNQAETYCRWVGKRLPSEAEWERAARGDGDQRIYPWGNDWNETKANAVARGTVPVGSYKEGVSPYGAYDMAGNVWEWVQDWFDENYYQNGPEQNPKGPEAGTSRGLRGGSWRGDPGLLRISCRRGGDPGDRGGSVGFRCAQ